MIIQFLNTPESEEVFSFVHHYEEDKETVVFQGQEIEI